MSTILPITTITELQRKARKVIEGVDSYKIILSNNEEIGVIMNVQLFKNIWQIMQEQKANYTDDFVNAMAESEKEKAEGNLTSFDDIDDAII